MRTALKLLLIIITICTGLVFLYSAYTKIYSLESLERFQYTIVEYVHLPWVVATWGGRLLIGMEAGIGLLVLTHFFGNNKWVLKAALALLVVFSIYLVYLWMAVGDNINCGCFGDVIWMSPSSSLIKNVVLIGVIVLIIKAHKGISIKRHNLITVLTLVIFAITPFIMFPLPVTQPNWLNKGKYKIDLSALYSQGRSDAPSVDLNKGKHIIAFFSLTCPHCKMAAYKMHVMKKKNPSLPFYIVIAGNNKNLKPFWKDTNAESIPHTKLSADEFTAIAGYSWPAIFMINNGIVEAETNYVSMDQQQIENWLAKP